ncbi:MAG: anhydro-N-acetylmuramic acid kinase [Candidatus Brocadiia bacterium]
MGRRSSQPSLVIGLMSGTSRDGVDAALVALSGGGPSLRAELLAFRCEAYSPAVRRLLGEVCSTPGATADKVCRASFLLGELFAQAALAVAREAGVAMSRVGLIGSHGQTVQHLPEPTRVAGRRIAGTLQIGEPAVVAERTGVTTVADFRPRDMACGGQGAPLVPLVDYLLYRHALQGRLVLNLGGIANVTHLPPGCTPEEVLAFDTGPGNMVLDGLSRALSGGRRALDRHGAAAARGRVDAARLRRWLRHPYFRKQPPKSTGRETFGEVFVRRLLDDAGGSTEADLLATATALTAETVHQAYQRWLRPRGPVDEVLASGGGCHNRTLMRLLAERFRPVPVRTTDDFGIPADAKEAVAFAILARETVHGRPGNLPGATGASRPAVLGTIVPGRNGLPIP